MFVLENTPATLRLDPIPVFGLDARVQNIGRVHLDETAATFT